MPTKNTTREATSKLSGQTTFPIVGLGASAGGLEALKAFFTQVPAASGMAYVVVVHLTPKQPSLLPELLRKVTALPVATAADGQPIARDHIYIIPPNKDIAVYKGALQLLDRVRMPVAHPIDVFLKSLAQDQGSNAAAVILSGTGTDGTLGIREIKAREGLVLVQTESSAQHDGMPRSAISTGLVDMTLPPQEMPKILGQFFSRSAPPTLPDPQETPLTQAQQGSLHKVFTILRDQIGHDFSAYKTNTLLRRINRRMGLNQIENPDTYVRYLRESPKEVEALFRELLIGVTSFFRDPKSFESLSTGVLPDLIEDAAEDGSLRVWVPGCSTGEEVYSLAIVLCECLEKRQKRINLQLFGTDIDRHAVDKAREALYPASIGAEVNAQRLKRFFTKEGEFYHIRKEIRDQVIFSTQNVTKDPPFSRLDLLCCRNLLIYLNNDAQKKLLPLFHYTLNPHGVLVLGSSETIGSFSTLFETVDKKWKIFRRREVPQALRQWVEFPSGAPVVQPDNGAAGLLPAAQPPSLAAITQKAILDQFAPTAILVDAKGNILHFQGSTGKYLETPSGPPTQNILNLARPGLRIELSSALRAAASGQKPIVRKRIGVKTNGDVALINLRVCPQQAPKALAGRILVVFEALEAEVFPAGSHADADDGLALDSASIGDLEKELQHTRESHQTTIEELESSNEELKSTNEELQSAIEELQSTNEEMESSKEELQSLNEELQTVNAELQSKVDELGATQDDMRNLLNSTEIATVFVDNDMCIRRFTQEATALINLIPTDIGRPLKHMVSNLRYDGMIADLDKVLSKLTPTEAEVQVTDGQWYNMRIVPYRTIDNRIDGAVLTFSNIGEQIKAQTKLAVAMDEKEQERALVRTIFDMNTDPMVVLDAEGKMDIANQAFSKLMGTKQDDISGMDIIGVLDEKTDRPDFAARIRDAVVEGSNFNTEAIAIKTPAERQIFIVEGSILKKRDGSPYRILLRLIEK